MHLPLELDAPRARDEDAQRPVGNAHHLVDHGRGPDLIEILPVRRICVRVAHGHERDRAVAGDGILDELDRPLLADRERRHRIREHHGLLEREHRQRRRKRQVVLLELVERLRHRLVLTSIVTLSRGDGFGAIGSLTCKSPRRYVAVAPSGSTSSPKTTLRWNGPYSTSICWYWPPSLGLRRSPATIRARGPATSWTSSGSTPGSSTMTVNAGGSSWRKKSTFGR